MSTKPTTTQPTKKKKPGRQPGSKGITDEPALLAKMKDAGWTETTKTHVSNRQSSGFLTKVVHVAPPSLASGRNKGEGKQYETLLKVARQHYPEFLTDEQKRKDAARPTPACKTEPLRLPDNFATTSQLIDVVELKKKMEDDGWTCASKQFFMSEKFASARGIGKTKTERLCKSLAAVAWHFYRDHILSIDDVNENPYKEATSLEAAVKACVAEKEKAFTEAGGDENSEFVQHALGLGSVDRHYLTALAKRLHPNESDSWINTKIMEHTSRVRTLAVRSSRKQVSGGESLPAKRAREIAERIDAAQKEHDTEVHDAETIEELVDKIENERNFLYTKTGDERFKDLSFLEILEKYGDNLCIYIGTRGFYKGSTKDERQFREEPFGQLTVRQTETVGRGPPIIMGQNCGSVFTNAEPGASATIAQLRDVVDGPKFRVAVLHTHHVKLNVRNIETLLHSRHHHRGLPGRLWRHIGAGASGFDKKTNTFDVGHHEVFLTYSFKLKQMVEDGVFAVAE